MQIEVISQFTTNKEAKVEFSQRLNRIYYKVFIPILLFLVSCQTTDFPRVFGPRLVTRDIVTTNYGNYYKYDTVFKDTTTRKNKLNYNVVKALDNSTAVLFGNQATVLGDGFGQITGLKTDSLYILSIVGSSLDSIFVDSLSFTVTGFTISGYLRDTIINRYQLVTTLPSDLPKVSAANSTLTGPSNSVTALEVVFRDQGNPIAVTIGSLSSSPFTDVPSAFLQTLTQGNKELKSTLASDKVKGWRIAQINNIGDNGGSNDVSDGITLGIRNGISGVLTYYPDGYYTFVSAIDSTYNQFGWYRISMLNGQPVGIVYQVANSGSLFSDPPLFPNLIQGYGIWGLASNAFYPIIRLDKFKQAVLTCFPYEY